MYACIEIKGKRGIRLYINHLASLVSTIVFKGTNL